MVIRYNKNIQGTRDSDNYKTPKVFYKSLDKEFHFDFDPCPYKHKLSEWDGLKIDWNGNIFVNPPYSQIELWLKKGIKEIRKGNANNIVFLIPLRTDSWYWHNTILRYCKEVRLVRGRLNFGRKELALFPVVLIVFEKKLNGEKILSSYEKNGVGKSQKKIIKVRRNVRRSIYSLVGIIIILGMFTPALLLAYLLEPWNPVIALFVTSIVMLVISFHLHLLDPIMKRWRKFCRIKLHESIWHEKRGEI